MLLALAVLSALVWFLCYSVFSVTGELIHVFLVLAVILIGLHILRKKRVLWSRDQG